MKKLINVVRVLTSFGLGLYSGLFCMAILDLKPSGLQWVSLLLAVLFTVILLFLLCTTFEDNDS